MKSIILPSIAGIASFLVLGAIGAEPVAQSITVQNSSGRRVEIFYLMPESKALHLMTKTNPIEDGQSFNLNSFPGHSFEVREVPERSTGECGGIDMECRSGFFSVGTQLNPSYLVSEDFEVNLNGGTINIGGSDGDFQRPLATPGE